MTARFEGFLPSALPDAWRDWLGDTALDTLRAIGHELDTREHASRITPDHQNILRVFDTPPESVTAVIVGQDPYPTASLACGLAFSVERDVVTLPASLRNIRRELADDLDMTLPAHGDLSAWAAEGVLLLNRHLTTTVGHPAAHTHVGWSDFTNLVISAIASRRRNAVAVLWGKQAQELLPLCEGISTITSAHPSPLSAHRGFFGSRPFSRVNGFRAERGLPPIDWSLDKEA